jgi:hypothetical protein
MISAVSATSLAGLLWMLCFRTAAEDFTNAGGLPIREVTTSRTKIPRINAFAVEYFIAPWGDDANPGTKEAPFATLEKARDAIRALKARGALPGPVGVDLLPGEYAVTGTCELTDADSGTEAAPICITRRSEAPPCSTAASGCTISTRSPTP